MPAPRTTPLVPKISPAEIERLVIENTPLAKYLAMRWVRSLGEAHIDDLMAAGVVGLVEAAYRYDPSYGTKFGTYAGFHIRATLNDYVLRAKGAVLQTRSGHGLTLRRKIGKARTELWKTLHREATAEEITAYLGESLNGARGEDIDAVKLVLERDAVRDLPVAHHDGGDGMIEVEGATPDPEDVVAEAFRRDRISKAVHAAVAQLSPRDQKIVLARYCVADEEDARTLSGLGAELGISKERVRQLEKAAMERLRQLLAAKREVLLNR